ncbi:MAG TPA: PEP-CTERM sorting domain-containing protein [Aquabacterium sp.]|uniref:PEP-CTERM sorting domain-containing protein n=1 Tax=Aquabacterium sp. TaxID=1872578 RepID=UPI002E333A91|nr:PEP-CTERM sorting domain-containing protein [Aquabacterium sp.]HEX5355137.1 PEP-CTERM sorting domain-containing protein [Aquabacterium sp.]
MKQAKIFLATMAAVFGMNAQAAMTVADNFNDGTFSGWTTQAGSFSESGGVLTGTTFSLATLDGASATTLGVDAISGAGVSYVALILNYSSLSDNLFVKLQDNTGDGKFDRVFMYRGNNGSSATTGSYYFDLSTEVESSYFEASVNNVTGLVTAKVGATGDVFSGTLSNSYTGTGVGIGFYGNATANNYYVPSAVPEPEALAMLLAGVGVVGVMARKRRVAR